MFATVNDGTKAPITNLYTALNKGLEKVISTIGIHELRGYGRLYSSIGLHEEIANILQITNFFGSNDLAFSLESLAKDDENCGLMIITILKLECENHFIYSRGFGKQLVMLQKEILMMITATS